eukprot:7887684-Ditylum_brightwellii.AAC.1
MKLGKENGNNLWFDVQKKGASTLRNMDTFELISENSDLTGYQYVPLIYAWDIKKEHDFSMHKIEEYGNVKEEEPYGIPEPRAHPSIGIPIDKTVQRQALM